MAIFRYEAADVNGKVLRGAMDAPTQDEVARRLEGRGYRSVQVLVPSGLAAGAAPVSAALAAPVARARGIAFGGAVAPEDLALFFRQMASLLHAGFTVSSALADLAPRTAHRAIGAAAAALAAETGRGGSLGEAMARHPGVFAPHVIGLVGAGEAGGFVEFAFEEAALGAEQDAALRQGLWLPKVLIWQAVWSVLILQPLFPQLGRAESVAGGLLGYGRAVLFWSVPVGIGLHLLVALLGWMWRQPFAGALRDRFSLAFPVMRRLARARGMAAFTRVLRRLLLAGVSAEPAWVGACRAVPNGVLASRLMAGVPVLRRGQGMDEAIAATGVVEHDPLQLLVTGQRTGQWAEMLDRVTGQYQEEAAGAISAAKAAQKRAGVLITIIATGYVTIALTHGSLQFAFDFTDKMFAE